MPASRSGLRRQGITVKAADHPNNKIGKLIGTPTQQLEGPEKVSGRAIYATDVVLPGMLWGKVLRSPISYGRINQIDIRRALALPGCARSPPAKT